MRLQAILFGMETLVDRRDVERDAFNRVFHEAGLPWQWDAASYARLHRLSGGSDVLDVFIRTERPRWRNSEDLQHLLAAVRRRHAAVCRDLAAGTASADKDMIAIAEAARATGLRLCAIVPPGQAMPEVRLDIAAAETHNGALAALTMPATACITIECLAEGFDAAANAGIVALDKLAISPSSGVAHDTAVITLLEDVHARAKATATASRLLSMAMIA